MRRVRAALVLVLLISTSLAPISGCESAEENVALTHVIETPMPLDPTQPPEIARWWTNDRELLRLDEPGSYTLWASTNRYDAPIETGSWSYPRYYEVRLAPYAQDVDWIHVGVSRETDGLRLHREGMTTFHALERPPHVLEDDLVGTWSAASGVLRVSANGRYVFTPPAPTQRGVSLRHEGTWRVHGASLRLSPDTPNLGPFTLEVKRGDNKNELVTASDRFQRVPDEGEATPFP